MSKRTILMTAVISSVIIVLLIVGIFLIFFRKDDDKKTDSQNVLGTSNINSKISTTMNEQNDLKIEDIAVGTGPEVKSGDTVVMNYVGTLTDGTKFDSSYDRGVPFTTMIGVGQVIQGWDQGVPGMKVGGKRKLTIPGNMAYGSRGVPGVIPANATLIFEVELVAIK